jgi:hypothetical protein
VIIRVNEKVEGWLSLWRKVLGVGHSTLSQSLGAESASVADGIVPLGAWQLEKVEALFDMTLDVQPELWELENKKDEVRFALHMNLNNILQ